MLSFDLDDFINLFIFFFFFIISFLIYASTLFYTCDMNIDTNGGPKFQYIYTANKYSCRFYN